MNTIDMKKHFEGVSRQIAKRMATVYGSKINEWCVRQRLENMRTKYQMFMQFLSRPCVFFNNDDNRVVVDCNYFHSTVQVTGDKSEMKGEFQTSGSI